VWVLPALETPYGLMISTSLAGEPCVEYAERIEKREKFEEA
jgi:hypothetical protein